MKIIFLVLAVMCLPACSAMPVTGDKVPAPGDCPLTRIDTSRQQELCRHYAGEEPYDATRAAYLKRKMADLNCGLYF